MARNIHLILACTLALYACGDDGWTVTITGSATDNSTTKLPVSWTSADDPKLLDLDGSFVTHFDSLPTEGKAEQPPWAGSYWPTHEDSINKLWDMSTPDKVSTTAKFEQAFFKSNLEDAVSTAFGIDSRSSATSCTQDGDCDKKKGEKCSFRQGSTEGRCVETWFGLCHAWAPAATMIAEPVHPVVHNGVEFKVNDIKALVTLSFTKGLETRFLSTRCNDTDDGTDEGIQYDEYGVPTEDFSACADTNPGTFHVVAANYLGLMKKAFIEDRTFDYEVWNQPVASFQVLPGYPKKVTAAQANALMTADGEEEKYLFNDKAVDWRHVRTAVKYITESNSYTDGNLASNIQQYTKQDTYEYILELDASGNIIGGEWLGSSKKNHPDFLWTGEVKANTEVALPRQELDKKELNVAQHTWVQMGSYDVTPGQTLRVDMRSTREKEEQGDVDLYVRYLAKPNASGWHCRPYRNGSTERCEIIVPPGHHVAFVGIYGAMTEDDVEVSVATMTPGSGIAWKEVEMLLEKSLAGPNAFAPDGDEAAGAAPTHGGLDWGDSCEGGFADLDREVDAGETIEIGLLPTGKLNPRIEMQSSSKLSFIVTDKISGTMIVGGPNALLKSAGEGCVSYYGAKICWSGNGGTVGSPSHDWFYVDGVSTRELVVRVESKDDASTNVVIEYRWETQSGCEGFDGESYELEVDKGATEDVATIAEGQTNVLITLTADADLDLQLMAGDEPIVLWDDDLGGLLHGPDEVTAEWEDVQVTYSGYSGIDGEPGHEFIKLQGEILSPLTVQVYGYGSGTAQVTTSWGLPDDQVAP